MNKIKLPLLFKIQLLVNIKNLLMSVPLYFLMAFLGHASDLEHNAKETKAKATKDAGLPL